MADADQTSKELLSILPPNTAARGRRASRNTVLSNARSRSRVDSGYGVILDGSAGCTTILYLTDIPAGAVLVDGVYTRTAAEADQVLIGASQDIISYDVLGAAAIVMPSDDFDVKFAIVAILVAGALEYRAVFGAPLATGTAVAPTITEIRAALLAAAITDVDLTVGVVFARGIAVRGTGTVVITGVDPATDDALKAEQVIGSLLKI